MRPGGTPARTPEFTRDAGAATVPAGRVACQMPPTTGRRRANQAAYSSVTAATRPACVDKSGSGAVRGPGSATVPTLADAANLGPQPIHCPTTRQPRDAALIDAAACGMVALWSLTQSDTRFCWPVAIRKPSVSRPHLSSAFLRGFQDPRISGRLMSRSAHGRPASRRRGDCAEVKKLMGCLLTLRHQIRSRTTLTAYDGVFLFSSIGLLLASSQTAP